MICAGAFGDAFIPSQYSLNKSVSLLQDKIQEGEVIAILQDRGRTTKGKSNSKENKNEDEREKEQE